MIKSDQKTEINLKTRVQYLSGVGPSTAAKLEKLGIQIASDLIYYYPRRYEDYTKITKISDLQNQINQVVTIQGTILGISNKRTSRRGMTVTEAMIVDGTGTIKAVWFNQPFLTKLLLTGSTVILNGKVSFNFFSREILMESPNRAKKPCIVPIYGETAGISSYYIQKLISKIKHKINGVEEYLPQEIIQRFDLIGIKEALCDIHFPENTQALERAQRRIAFDELFLVSIRAGLIRQSLKEERSPIIEVADNDLALFVKALPFELTLDQKKSAWQAIKDMRNDYPMNRLINGDVGSGKTVVAAIAAYAAIKSGFRVVFMVPTSILASQHFDTLSKMFSSYNISVGLYTSARKDLSIKNDATADNASKKTKKSSSALSADLIIGTQALIQRGVEIENIGLVIVDEQHRFGVSQRQAISKIQMSNFKFQMSNENNKTDDANELIIDSKALSSQTPANLHPHFLSMTATPIPRTLHLALFGDLDISVIKEKPKNRKEVKTKFVMPQNRAKSYDFIKGEIKSGRQAFVICPLIESGDVDVHETLFEEDRKSVLAEFKKLSKEVFPEFNIGVLHGKMKQVEKDKVMEQFSSGELNILVSTSVVEVGVDVPNATVMMIEDAERFGLAQIHQFRGRVGRADYQSYCLLFSSTMSPKAIRRLETLEKVADGFSLAEIDLETRGPGELFGTMQSGDFELKMASISDRVLIEEASSAAKEIIDEDSELKNHPLLASKIADFMQTKHME